MSKTYHFAVVGATGLVGQTVLSVLEEKNLPISDLTLLASKRSAGVEVEFKGETYVIKELNEEALSSDIDIAIFAAGGSISEKYASIANEKGITVIDNSSFFRMVEDVPLVVPEINAGELTKEDKLIANPNCSTIQSVLPLAPLKEKYGIKRVVYNTYQAVSGAGHKGIADLENNTTENFQYPIRETCIPQIDVFLDNGYTAEEMKMVNETHKILGDDSIAVTATCVRVPIKHSHAVSINVELKKPFEVDEVRALLENTPGIVVQDDPENEIYPLQNKAAHSDNTYVGRIRRDYSQENTLNMWVVADNIRKGAATNSVQIAEYMMENDLV